MSAPLRKLFYIALIAAPFIACEKAPNAQTTATMRPAPPRPSPLPPADASIGQKPIITTTGSPPPWPNEHAQFEVVDVDDHTVKSPPKIVRANVPFRITNGGTKPHALVLDSANTHIELPEIAPGQTVILTVTLRDAHYTWTCRIAGHSERGSFDTYVPNSVR